MSTTLSVADPDTYVMGYASDEIRRIQKQAALYAPATRRFLTQAGITEGMHVLDVGTGAGDVALLLAELVGPTGTVVGVDSSPTMVAVATARARAAGFHNVTFLTGDVTRLTLDIAFDALVGRIILAHLDEPVAALRRLVQHVRPTGLVAFMEFDLEVMESVPAVAPFEEAAGWACAALRRVGRDIRMGMHLYGLFLEAGLPPPALDCAGLVGGGPDWTGYEVLADVVRTLHPLIEQLGIATREEIALDSLAERCQAAVVAQGAMARTPDLMAAWSRVGATGW